MKILISHVYSSDNKGDAAILSAQISELRRVYKDCSVKVLTLDSLEKTREVDGAFLENSLMHFVYYSGLSPIPKMVHVLFMSVWTLVWAFTKSKFLINLPVPKNWKTPLSLLSECDIQVGVGGGYLRGKADFRSTVTLWLLVHQILLAKILGKPMILYAQSFGPFYGFVQKQLAKIAFSSTELILAREEKSLEFLKDLGVPNSKIELVADTAFLLEGEGDFSAKKYFGASCPEKIVGLTARQWLDPLGQAKYERALRALILHIGAKGWGVLIIPQVTAEEHNDDDRIVGRRLMEGLGSDRVVNLEENLQHRQIKALYSDLDYLVGTRFHSVIFSLSAGVPAFAIEYEHKTQGILKDLDLGEWFLFIDSVTPESLIGGFEKLINSKSYTRDYLRKVVPNYLKRSYRGAELISIRFPN